MRRGSGGKGFHFGTTSENPVPLRADDGGLRHNTGLVRNDHAISREHNRPQRGSGFTNPEPDYGPKTMGRVNHINDPRLVGPAYPPHAGYTAQPDKRGPGASTARVKAGSATEYFPGHQYGYPARRQDR